MKGVPASLNAAASTSTVVVIGGSPGRRRPAYHDGSGERTFFGKLCPLAAAAA